MRSPAGRSAFRSQRTLLTARTSLAVAGALLAITVDPLPTEAHQRAPTCHGTPATIVGTRGNDLGGSEIVGTPRRDVIAGLGGNDVIDGRGGRDLICGGPGRDFMGGGPGADLMLGGFGRDVLLGQAGDDLLKGNGGEDALNGKGGYDRCLGGADDDVAAPPPACNRIRSAAAGR
jgi:hypothetical protein